MTLRQFYLLLQRHLAQVQREDCRFFYVLQALVGKRLVPGQIFPSLARPVAGEPEVQVEDVHQLFALLSGAVRESG